VSTVNILFLGRSLMMKKYILPLLLCGFLISCAATLRENHIKTKLNSWVGVPEDTLILRWGVPSSVYDGGRIHYATYHRVSENGVNWCDVTFEIENKLISGYRRAGNLCHYLLRNLLR
jgi:hypothetical protein